jgi:hypothetical protein
MSVELGKLSQWLIANKLSINLSKTHYILFWPGRKSLLPNPKLEFDGHVLEGKQNTQFLGVILNARLSWLEHSSYVRNKIAKNIGIINKVRHILSPSTLKTLYTSFVYPYLTYCIEVWGSAPRNYIDPIIKLQKRCCRILTKSAPRTASLPLFQQLKILPLPELYEYRVLMFMGRNHKNLLPNALSRIFSVRQHDHAMTTRQVGHLTIPRFRFKISQSSISYAGVRLWNSIIDNCRTNSSLKILKDDILKKIWRHLSNC